MLIDLNLENLKRELRFPFPLLRAGMFEDYTQALYRHAPYRNLEVCLRCGSSAPSAEDSLDGVMCHTPFPHFVVKDIGVCHEFGMTAPREGLYLIYSPAIALQLRGTGVLADFRIEPFRYSGLLYELIAEFRELLAVSVTRFTVDRLDLAAFRILEELYRDRKLAERDAEPDERIRRAASWLRMRPEQPFDAAETARRFGFSERSFFRHWSRVFAQSPGEFVLTEKLRHATYLLGRTHLGIGEIARTLGFCDDNYFSNRFRRAYGVSPRAWRAERHSEL